MGEYLFYKKEEVKIGTLENLYYISYPKYTEALKRQQLSAAGSTSPAEYAKADSGFRFRFPFPDEDKLPFGEIIEPFDRGIPVRLSGPIAPSPDTTASRRGQAEVLITQQKLVKRKSDSRTILALLLRDPHSGESFRVEGDAEIKRIIQQIVRHHIIDNANGEQKQFYREVAVRIMKGYRMDVSKQAQKPSLKQLPPKRHGRRLK